MEALVTLTELGYLVIEIDGIRPMTRFVRDLQPHDHNFEEEARHSVELFCSLRHVEKSFWIKFVWEVVDRDGNTILFSRKAVKH